MKENQTDLQVAENQSGQQKQGGQPGQGNQRTSESPSQKSTAVVEDEEEQTDIQKERPGKEHQHDYKTPAAEQNQQDENQNRSQTENTIRNVSKNQNSNQGAE